MRRGASSLTFGLEQRVRVWVEPLSNPPRLRACLFQKKRQHAGGELNELSCDKPASAAIEP